MRSVRLPAAEQWASGMSEQQWRHQVDRLLGRSEENSSVMPQPVLQSASQPEQGKQEEAQDQPKDEQQS